MEKQSPVASTQNDGAKSLRLALWEQVPVTVQELDCLQKHLDDCGQGQGLSS